MNIYACYTPSHFKLYWKYFNQTAWFDSSIISKKLPAIGNGNYKNQHWSIITMLKLEMIIEIINYGVDDIFIFCDVDIQFFGSITNFVTKSMIDKDIVTQIDPSGDYEFTYCTGFMAIRISPNVKNFFEKVLNYMIANCGYDDQDAFNVIARQSSDIKFGTFDGNVIWSHRKMWKPGVQLSPPNEILVHHANWTSSIDHKIDQMSIISEKCTHR